MSIRSGVQYAFALATVTVGVPIVLATITVGIASGVVLTRRVRGARRARGRVRWPGVPVPE